MNPTLTIIIPVYNMEKYLRRCQLNFNLRDPQPTLSYYRKKLF